MSQTPEIASFRVDVAVTKYATEGTMSFVISEPGLDAVVFSYNLCPPEYEANADDCAAKLKQKILGVLAAHHPICYAT